MLINRSIFLPYLRVVNCLFHLFFDFQFSSLAPNVFLGFSNHQRAVYIFLFLSLVICPSMASWRRQFLLRNWPIQLVFQRRILFRSVLFSPIRLITSSLVTPTGHFIISILLQHRILKFSNYFFIPVLSVPVSEP